MSEVEGGSDGNGNSDQGGQHQFTIEEKIIIVVLEDFKSRMEAWLSVHDKGPLSNFEMSMLDGLPGCIPEDVEIVERAYSYVDEILQDQQAKVPSFTEKVKGSSNWNIITTIGEGLELESEEMPELADNDLQAAGEVTCPYLMEEETMDDSFQDYIETRINLLVNSTDGKVLGFIFCEKCENKGVASFDSEVLDDQQGELLRSASETCLIIIYNQINNEIFSRYDEASDEMSFNLVSSYNPTLNKSLLAYLNLEHEALVNLNSPFLTCSNYINDQLSSIQLCDYESIDQQIFDNILSAIEKCIEANGHSIISPMDYDLLNSRLDNNLAKDENIKLFLKTPNEEKVLYRSDEEANYEVEFKKKDGKWSASVNVSEDYLSSLGFNQQEISELQRLLGELFMQSQVKFCKEGVSPGCFPEMLTFLQVLNINIQSIAQTGSTHSAMWDDNAHQDIDHMVPHDYKWHPIVGGAIDGGVDAVTSVPVLIYTAGDIILDKGKQQTFKGMFSEEGMQQLLEGIFSSLAETLSEEDKKEHAISKASVELALAYYIVLGKAAKGIKEALEKAGVLAKKLDKNPNLHLYLKKVIKDSPDPELARKLDNVLGTIESSDLEKLLAKLDKDQIDDYISDLSGNASLARKFASEELSVDSWRKMFDANISDVVRSSTKNLQAVTKWADEGIEVTFEAIQDGAKVISKNGDEVGSFITRNGEEVFEISDDFFVDAASSTGKVLEDVIPVVSNTGETFVNPKFVKLADGSLGFVEDVSSFGSQAVQSTIKQRGALRKSMAGIKATEDAHHLIPVQLLKENDVVKKAVEAGFEFNTTKNGLAIEKFVKKTGAGRHGPHPKYTDQIRKYLGEWAEQNPNFTPQMAKDELTDIVDLLKNKITTTSGKINELSLGL